MNKHLYLIPIVIVLSGCTMIPKYTRPQAPIPTELSRTEGVASSAPRPMDLEWGEFITDPHLQTIVAMALENNRDLRIASLNVEKMQAIYRVQRSQIYPNYGIQADGQRYRIPEQMAEEGNAEVYEQYSVNLGFASWELDLFGRLRSMKKAALERFLATREARKAARIALIATVARQYVAMAVDQESLSLSEKTLAAQESYRDLISVSRDAGVATDLDLERARSQVEAVRVNVEHARALVALNENLINLLVGKTVPHDLLPMGLESVGDFSEISSGLSSQVLLQRPDIRGAEEQLKATYADIGAARAAFFPRISLTAALGTMSPQFSGLFKSGSYTWTVSPQLLMPIYAHGKQLANLKVSKINRKIALARYEKAIQTAFREVRDDLLLRESLDRQIKAQRAIVDAAAETLHLSQARYEEGLDGYLGVLIAQRTLYSARQGLLQLRRSRRVIRVALYEALGGGGKE